MQELFRAVRSASSAGTWSQGVELVRRCAVTGVSSEPEQVICRVKKEGRVVATTVTLFPEDAEWDCDCGSRVDPCDCVTAAVIALKHARDQGQELPELRGGQTRLVYRFERRKLGLALQRVLVRADGTEALLTRTLAGLASEESLLSPSQNDISIDRTLLGKSSEVLQADTLSSVLTLLADAANVELDGQSIQVSSVPVGPRAVLRDAGKGYSLLVEQGSEVSEVVAPGSAVAEGRLVRLKGTDFAGARWEKLPHRADFTTADAHRLVTEILPKLQRSFDVDVQTTRLPSVNRSTKPRAVVDVEQVGHSLSLMATIVYGDPPVARVDGDRLVYLDGDIPLRDVEAERRAATRLREQLNVVPGVRLHLEGLNATTFAEKLDAWNGDIRGAKRAQFISSAVLEPRISRQGAFQLDFHTEAADAPQTASLGAALQAWQSGLSLVPLLEGGWARLPEGFFAKHGDRVLDLLNARDQNGQISRHAYPALAALCDDLEQPRPPEFAELEPLIDGFQGIQAATLPGDLSADLRPYQRQGVNWLSFLRDARLGAVLADDMGLGKTLQALCAIRGATLVVCPTSVIHNWADEIARFRPGLSVSRYHGTGRTLNKKADVVLTTYALLRLDQEQLSAVEWDCVILDEAQMIKNPDSQVAQAAFTLNAAFRLSLSGTPVENRLDELWSQFHFVNRGLLGGRSDFKARFADPIALGDPNAAASLREKVKPFLLRRLKREVAPELPPRTDVVLRCDLSETERAVYDAIHAATQQEVVERLQGGGNMMEALEALLRLRQAACHSALVPGQAADTSSKVESLCEALQGVAASGHKALVFSQWTGFLDLVEPHLAQRGIAFTRLDGSTRDRQGVVKEFQAENGPPVMLLSLKAGGTGLNLTSADHVFLLDLWWNPAVEDQAADRAHRIGQERPVMVYRLVAKDTVEERILLLQEKKRSVADAALGDATHAAQLTREDLLSLLQ